MFNSSNFLESVLEICNEKKISKEIIFDSIREGIAKSYERFFDPEAIVEVEIDEEKGTINAYTRLTVVEEVEDEWIEISLDDSKKYGKYEIGDSLLKPIDIDGEFSNLAVLKVGSTVKQKIRDAEKNVIYDHFLNKVGELGSGQIKDITDKTLLVNVDGLTIPFWNQKLIPGEIFGVDQRIIFYIEYVDRENKHQQVGLTRTHSSFIRKILEIEVPEISVGIVEIIKVVREPGVRAKVSVKSNDPNIDPVGCCIGPGGSRIKAVVKELHNEKVDMVLYDTDKITYLLNALSPVRVVSVEDLSDENGTLFRVVVPEEHLSLAIGRNGTLIKIIAKLVEGHIDVLTIKQAEEEEIEILWNGNLSKEEYESRKWISEKNFRNWAEKTRNLKRQASTTKLTMDDFDRNAIEDFSELENNRVDDDFYDQDHEEYFLEEDDESEE